jgi:hypothetical protein
MMTVTAFQHVLITRFNLATPGRESDIRNRPGWLAERFDLFDRHCLPSVAAQTVTDFVWVVLFDEETPAPFKERIEACRRVYPFTPVFTPMFRGDDWIRIISNTAGLCEPWLLTTRLDNDDALARDFVERLHAEVRAAPAERAAFNFTRGFVVCHGRVYALTHTSNAFVSLLEQRDAQASTVMAHRHMSIGSAATVRQIGGPGGWIQMVHGGNVSNKIRGRRVAPQVLQDRIPPGAAGSLSAASSASILVDNLLFAPLREGRDSLVNRLRGRR